MNEPEKLTKEQVTAMIYEGTLPEGAECKRQYEGNKLRVTMKNGQRFTLTVEEEPT